MNGHLFKENIYYKFNEHPLVPNSDFIYLKILLK